MQLTPAGKEIADQVVRRHRILKKFFGGILGLPPETRAFKAHITLARFQRPPRFLDLKRLKDWADNMPKLPEPFAPEIVLYRSELTKHGAIHTPLARHELEMPIS